MKKQKYFTILLIFSLGFNTCNCVPEKTNYEDPGLHEFFQWMQVGGGGDIDGEGAGNRSGSSVSMPDAYTVAIGAPANNGNGFNAGHVRVFSWDGSRWMQKGDDINGEAEGDHSGESVSMPDANTIAIGAEGNDGNGDAAGHVRVFSWDGSRWVRKGRDIDGEVALDYSGSSVSMPDANTVAIGAPLNHGTGDFSGHVRVFRWDGSRWMQKGDDINGESAYDRSGASVSMPDANTVAIGAASNNGGGNTAGHVRVFRWNGSRWVRKGRDINGEAAGDQAGRSVSMPDANTVAVGAPRNKSKGAEAGHVRVYSWNGRRWVQKGGDINGEAADDSSGWSVSMPDENTLAVGALGNDGNGRNAGRVRVFSWDGIRWVQRGGDINGEAAGDMSGYSVSMPDANTVGVGAPGNNGSAPSAGRVRVYTASPR